MANFTDDFAGTSGDDLESRTGWTRVGGSAGAAEINASNQLKFSATTATGYQAPAATDEDHWCQAVRRYTGTSASWFFPWCICLADTTNFIGCRFINDSGVKLETWKAIGGTFTKIATKSDPGAIGDTMKIARVGTAITVYRNGASEQAATVGAAELLNHKPGMRVRNEVRDPIIDDWESLQASAGFNASINGALAAVTANLATTHVPPAFNADLSPSLAAVDAALAGTHLPPAFVAALAATLAPVTAALASTHVPPSFAGTIGAVLQAVVADLSATHVPPGVVTTLAASLVAVQADASATHVPPVFAGTIGTTLGAVAASLAGTHIPPGLTVTIAATVAAVEAAAAGMFVLPQRSLIIGATLASVEAALEALSIPPPREGQIAATLAAVEASIAINLGIILPAEHRQVLLDAMTRAVLLESVERTVELDEVKRTLLI